MPLHRLHRLPPAAYYALGEGRDLVWLGPAVTNIRIHALRHTSALLAIEAGVSLEKIRDQLGHADITTTALYLRGRDPERAAAYRELRIDN